MVHTALYEEKYQKLMDSASNTELVMLDFLERYQKMLRALIQKGSFESSIHLCIPKLLFALSIIHKLHLQKYKLYCLFYPNSRHYLQNKFAESEMTQELRLNRSISLLKQLIIAHDPKLYSLSVDHLNDLSQFYIRKRRLFPPMNINPAPPWLHPSIKIGKVGT